MTAQQFKILRHSRPDRIEEQLSDFCSRGWKLEQAYATVAGGVEVHFAILSRPLEPKP